MPSDRSCTWDMVHNKIHLHSLLIPSPVESLLNRGLKHHLFISFCALSHSNGSWERSICCSTSQAVKPAPGAWFITKFISLAQVAPSPVYYLDNAAGSWLKTTFIERYTGTLFERQIIRWGRIVNRVLASNRELCAGVES